MNAGRNIFVMVNAGLVGLNEEERLNNYQLHPMIRNNWRSADPLRDTYLHVPAFYTDEDGHLRAYESMDSNGVPGYRTWEPVEWTDSAPNTTSMINGILDNAPVAQEGEFQVLFNSNNWNFYCEPPYMDSATADKMRDLLEYEGKDTEFSGVPYFVRYFGDAEDISTNGFVPGEGRFDPATEGVPPIINASMIDTDFYYYKFKHAANDPTVPDNINTIEINPVYNFYLDTSPPFERTVIEAEVPSSMLPNYYMMEANYKYASGEEVLTGMPYKIETAHGRRMSTPLQQVTEIFRRVVPASFGEGNPNYVTPSSRGYFQYYIDQIDKLVRNGNLGATISNYVSMYKNVAVLTPEMSTGFFATYNDNIRDDRGTQNWSADDYFAINTYPFYNEIIIPHLQHFPNEAFNYNTFFEDVEDAGAGFENTEKFLTLLQLLAIYAYNNPGTDLPGLTPLSMEMSRWNTQGEISNLVVNESFTTDPLIHLEDLIGALNNLGDHPDLVEVMNTLTNYYDGGSPVNPYANLLNTVILRDGFAADRDAPGEYFDWDAADLQSVLLGAAEAIMNKFSNFSKVFTNPKGVYQNSETFMYIVEKRVVPPGQDSVSQSDPVVQTLFFGRDIQEIDADQKPGIHYYDTQVKYGVKYQYDIKQVRLVYGNRYRYTSATTLVNAQERRKGRALGNALGLFAPESTLITTLDSFTRLADPGLESYVPTTGWQWQFPSTDSSFPFVAEGDEAPQIPKNASLVGTYIFKFNSITNQQAADQGIFTWSGTPAGSLGLDATDFAQLFLKAKTGEGFDGYASGGFVSGEDSTVVSQSRIPAGIWSFAEDLGSRIGNIFDPLGYPEFQSRYAYWLFTEGSDSAELNLIEIAIQTVEASEGFADWGMLSDVDWDAITNLVEIMESVGINVEGYAAAGGPPEDVVEEAVHRPMRTLWTSRHFSSATPAAGGDD